MIKLTQIGYIGKNVQGNRVYDVNGLSATLASQTGGLGGTGAGVYLIDDDFQIENIRKESDSMGVENKLNYKSFKYVSLFSGIGGFEQALNKLGGKCIMASEIDKYANQAYEILYGHKTVGDVTKVAAEDVPDHELLVGGFPCQAFSVAGNRKGFEDTRGTLFFEVARIAKVKQPKVILLENVKGLVGHDKGKTLEVIIQTLHDIGYTVDFNIINSKYYVPQNRERIFIVAVRNDLIKNEDWRTQGNNVLVKAKRRISELNINNFNFEWPEQNEVTTRLRDILESEVDERYYISEEKTEKLLEQLNDSGKPMNVKDGCNCVGRVDLNGHDYIKRVYDVEYMSPTIPTGTGGNHEPKIAEEVRACLTPDRENKRQMGRRFKESDEESFTVNTLDKHGVAIGNYPKYRIRKLTPRECFRLQGFPDSEFDKLLSAGISNSQLYKMAGNAVTVNVIEAIGEQLLPYLHND